VIAKGMAKRPEERHAKCRELVDAARRELGISSGEIPMPITPRRRIGRRGLAAGALAAAAIVAAAAALLATRGGSAKSLAPVPPNSVAVIDPAKNRVTAVVPVGSTPVSIAAGPNSVWFVNADDQTVSRIDPASNRAHTFAAGVLPADVAPGPSTWISGGASGVLTRVGGPYGYVTSVRVGPPSAPGLRRTDLESIAQGNGSVWVLDNGVTSDLVRVNRAGRITRLGVFAGATDLLYAANAIWVVDNSVGQVARVDPKAMIVVKRINVPDAPVGITAGGGAIWVVSPSYTKGGRLWRIDPVANIATASASVGRDATGVAFGDGSVWVMHSAAGTVQRIDPQTLRTSKTIAVGNHPSGIAFADGRLYATVDNGDRLIPLEGA
jgi:YVTN family beta-propeller protein